MASSGAGIERGADVWRFAKGFARGIARPLIGSCNLGHLGVWRRFLIKVKRSREWPGLP